MNRNPIVRLVAVAALGLVLAGPARAAGPEVPSLRDVWEWLEGLWGGADHGCGIDPDGKPRCAPVIPQADLGCGIDPDGKPRCSPGM